MTLLEKNIKYFDIPQENSAQLDDLPDGWVWDGTPIDRYTKRFNAVVPSKESLNHEQKEVLNQFALALQAVDESLQPFSQMGYQYTIALGGGAVRDFIMGRISDINDLDIFVCILDPKHYRDSSRHIVKLSPEEIKILYPNSTLESDYDLLKKEISQKIPEPEFKNYQNLSVEFSQTVYQSALEAYQSKIENEAHKKILTEVTTKIVEKTLIVNHVFHSLNDVAGSYLNEAMAADLKVQIPGVKYPIDLVLTSMPSENYISSFDFYLCEAAILYKSQLNTLDNSLENSSLSIKRTMSQNHNNAYCSFEENKEPWENVYDNLFLPLRFLRDVHEKTITLHTSKFTPEHIEYFLNKHYPKMVKKFPDHEPRAYSDDSLGYNLQKKMETIRLDIILDNKPAQAKLKI